MNQRMKQRLVGAIVLVALAVIFIPMLLRGPVERETTEVPVAIPPRPEVVVPEEPEPQPEPPSASVASAPAAQTQSPAAPAAPDTPTPAAPAPQEQSPRTPADLAAWAVQVGSFGAENNALKLRNGLRGKGYPAYVEAYRSGDRTLYRVRVGPLVQRTEAEQLQQTLARKESLKGLVVSHP